MPPKHAPRAGCLGRKKCVDILHRAQAVVRRAGVFVFADKEPRVLAREEGEELCEVLAQQGDRLAVHVGVRNDTWQIDCVSNS